MYHKSVRETRSERKLRSGFYCDFFFAALLDNETTFSLTTINFAPNCTRSVEIICMQSEYDGSGDLI